MKKEISFKDMLLCMTVTTKFIIEASEDCWDNLISEDMNITFKDLYDLVKDHRNIENVVNKYIFETISTDSLVLAMIRFSISFIPEILEDAPDKIKGLKFGKFTMQQLYDELSKIVKIKTVH